MFERLIEMTPMEWQDFVIMLLSPLEWIPQMQQWLVDFFFDSPSKGILAAKVVFLLFPLLLWIAAIWCTQLSLYTLPFRSGRLQFISMMLLAWWDGARAVWLYWIGLFRVTGVILGWLFAVTRLAVKLLVESGKQILLLPFTMTGKMTQSYFQPGVPWIAFMMLIFWCLLEAVIFTYTLTPTVSEVLADLVGMEPPASMGTALYLFLLLLILGSFACIQAFVDAVKKREYKFIIQMVLVEIFVMFFEVMFLYRELVDAVTPWIAQQTGEQFRLGIVFTLSLAVFGWAGIRGMTWFLFGQFGTPPLLAFISRRPMITPEQAGAVTPPVEAALWWRAPVQDFKGEIGWLHEKSDQLLEYLTLPVLQVMAAALNFALILVSSRPIFNLPLKGLKEVMATKEIFTLHLQPKRAER
ncbi:MAG: hypothetical protein MPW14_09220 [Candidatus Manganitrophus sp.]|nr:hypothetical protein [Candidatus Manganitrophus sp.]WDT70856.1 MAG: hypothetical protein MPW17_19250 [Candidatus Manganitrophus sp.]WDT81874.1 MAG: hypothetical protein MPW14_09220 [Candidatus Manganitrophus sp.]